MKKSMKWVSCVLIVGMLIGMLPSSLCVRANEQLGDNIILNPNFADADLSMWMGNGAQVSAEVSDTEILPGVTTYGKISGRTQTFQGFYQDVTDKVKAGETYLIEYEMFLPEEYQGEAESGRKGFFGPYLEMDDGSQQYLNQEYSSCISGKLSQTLAVGKWVHFEGTFTLPEEGGFHGVVVRFQEESSKKMLDYCVTGISMRKKEAGQAALVEEKILIETDVPAWKDSITSALGEDTIAGLAVTAVDLTDKGCFQLLTKHANAFTFGNELKPDYLFNYSNGVCPGKETITFNGKELLVPKINFAKIDKLVNIVVAWNEAHPDNKLRVRGHTLLWHAQTPEWWFHEDYDPKKDYVDKELMSTRMEWYIKTVLEHFTSENSPYKDVFYGWDVLNEAANDGSGSAYRNDIQGTDKLTDSTHGSKSSWWHIYQSNEYIIKAFTYANKYAPETLELYYNDYGDSSPVKCENICQILRDIKDNEGARGVGTRISALGMQAHYGLSDFSITNFEACARKYLDIVGAVQLTEFDMKASSAYDGTAQTKDAEYLKQALCFRSIFETLIRLNQIEGYEVTGVTFWGITDDRSWLQNASDLGGGADGLRSQCPLLFDADYKVKPAFYAFVDPMQIKPIPMTVTARKMKDASYKDGVEYSFEDENTSVKFVPMWTDEELKIQVSVTDKSIDDTDSVTLYLQEDNLKDDKAAVIKQTVTRKDASSIGGGYKVTYTVPLANLAVGREIAFDLAVNNNGNRINYCDFNGNQDKSSSAYAQLDCKPSLPRIYRATVEVDGNREDVWKTAETLPLTLQKGAKASAKVSALWDTDALYLYATVVDDTVGKEDGLVLYIDPDHAGGSTYAKDDNKIVFSQDGKKITGQLKKSDVTSVFTKTEDGYTIEAKIAWKKTVPKVHQFIGIEFCVLDADENGKQIGTVSYSDQTGTADTTPAAFMTAKMAADGEVIEGVEENTKQEEISESQTSPETEDSDAEPVVAPSGENKGLLICIFVGCLVLALLIGAFCFVKGKKQKKD